MRIGEAEGVEYHFVRKESIKQLIRDHSMVEWGELDNQLYGESFSQSTQKTLSRVPQRGLNAVGRISIG